MAQFCAKKWSLALQWRTSTEYPPQNGEIYESKNYGYSWYSKWWIPRPILTYRYCTAHKYYKWTTSERKSNKTEYCTYPCDTNSTNPRNYRPQWWSNCPTKIFQHHQRDIHDPNMYATLDHAPHRTIVDHQLLNHQNETVQNDMYLPPNNTSTPFQPHNQEPILVQQQAQSDPSDVVVQCLQQQALNQSQLNDTLSSIWRSQQNLQQETVSVISEMSKRHVNEQFIRDIQIFYGKYVAFTIFLEQFINLWLGYGLYIVSPIRSFWMQLGGVKLEVRKRHDTDGFNCRLHLLTLELLHITHCRCLTELNAF